MFVGFKILMYLCVVIEKMVNEYVDAKRCWA